MLQSVSDQIKPHFSMTGQKEMLLFLCLKFPFSRVFRVSFRNIPQKKGTAPKGAVSVTKVPRRGLMEYTEHPQTSVVVKWETI